MIPQPVQLSKSSPSDRLEPGRFARIVERCEEILFAIIVIALIILGLIPIVLRLAGMSGIAWITPLTRYCVVIIALLGAGTAVRERSSISVDIISHLLSRRKRLLLRAFTELLSALICGLFVWVGIRFVNGFDNESIAFLQIPEWVLALILPIGFGLLTLRLLFAVIEDIRLALQAVPAQSSTAANNRGEA